MDLNIIQILLLSLLGVIAILDSLTLSLQIFSPVASGFIAGIIVGDISSGLYIGGSLQLLILGVSTYGGASIPDYTSAAIISTALVATSGGSLTPEAAMTLAVPVGLLLINFDILARYSNTFIVQRIEADIENGKYESAVRKNLLGILTWGASRFIPIFIALILGNAYMVSIMDWVQNNIQWLLDGLSVAGGLLPVVGIAILCRYLPIKQYFYYAILGFLLVAYINVPITGVALFGLVIAFVLYNQEDKLVIANTNESAKESSLTSEEGIYEYDE